MNLTYCIITLGSLLNIEPPREIGELITVATRHEDTLMVASVIAAESAFNHKAISSAGAEGLMQVLPSTAKYLQERYGETCNLTGPRDMLNKARNISYGSCYLSLLTKQYNGDYIKVLIHYHSGGEAVKRYLKGQRLGKLTANYVLKVYRYYNECGGLK